MQSALYDMTITHVRLHPRPHTLRMQVTMMLLDLEEIQELDRHFRWFSAEKRNLASFHAADHGDSAGGGRGGDLRAWAARQLKASGISPPGGATRLLCMPRLFGRSFNPLSIFFCHRPDGTLGALIYEVHNTFGQRHAYAAAVDEDGARLRQTHAKTFHVSPFLPMAMRYRFNLARSAAGALRLIIDGEDSERRLIRAVMRGTPHAVTNRALLARACRMPMQGLQVLARIHLEALKLWWKGVALQPAPPPPAARVTRGA